MGRPFASELAVLPENLAYARQLPIEQLQESLEDASQKSVIACGAGGSFSAASFAQLLFNDRRVVAQATTPLQLLQMERPSKEIEIVLFTAGGRNKDVLRVMEYAHSTNLPLTLICASEGSPAAQKAQIYRKKIFEFSYPAIKDGFLAVNSLATTWWLLARSFGHTLPDSKMVHKSVCEQFQTDFIDPNRRHACLILHDRLTQPVAVDLESKFAEAGLVAPLVCDWRQFGHGRHNWLAKNASFSSVVSLELEGGTLADRTLALIPNGIPKTRIISKLPGMTGVCDLLIKSFRFVQSIGIRVNIDPGRPGVPPFGSSLYHLSDRTTRKDRSFFWDIATATRRKSDTLEITNPQSASYRSIRRSAKSYLSSLLSRNFSAIVFDFDGTIAKAGIQPNEPLSKEISTKITALLKNQISVGIATGRGDSCHGTLTRSIPRELWRQLFICYYNGSKIANLHEAISENIVWDNTPLLIPIFDELRTNKLLAPLCKIALKGPQITIRSLASSHRTTVETGIRAIIASRYSQSARLVVSSHTLDVVPITNTKTSLVEHLAHRSSKKFDILTIGDRGEIEGNDFQLLSTRFSLSVDTVSPDMYSCWNFLPKHLSNEIGTIEYLRTISINRGYFTLKPDARTLRSTISPKAG